MEEEEIPDYSLNKEIVEFNKKQLRKKASRSILRKMTIESDSESIYTDSEDEDVDQDEDITVLSRSLGALGINIRKQKRFMTSVKKEIVRSEPQQREKITENINWLKIFYDSVTHVQTINANITKMVRNSTTSNLANVLGTISGRANKKKFNSKRKTVPCVWYHGEVGCHRGTNCDFIHDPRYKGRKVPNMKNYVSSPRSNKMQVRPIHQLSKRPENNLINMMVYKKAVNTPEGVKPYNNRGGNNFQRNNNRYQNQHQRHQGGRPQAGYGQGYPQQQQHQKMGMNGFMGIVRTSGSKNQFYKPQYPARSHGGGNNGQFQNYNQTQQYNNYSQQQGQYNNQGNYGGYPQGERQQPVGNRQFHQNFNNNVGVNKHQVFNHQSNAVGNSNQR